VAATNGNGSITDKETLSILSGVASVAVGAGSILSSPIAKRYLGQIVIGNLAQSALPDLNRYLKLRAM
jgi:hypothetical protein